MVSTPSDNENDSLFRTRLSSALLLYSTNEWWQLTIMPDVYAVDGKAWSDLMVFHLDLK